MSENYLVHHGIEGQKWGVTNGPPYPLNPKDYSAAEKRLNKVSKQSEKYRAKSDSAKMQSAKLKAKAEKYRAKSEKQVQKAAKPIKSAFTDAHTKKAGKYAVKAADLIRKSSKMDVKSLEYDEKAKSLAEEIIQLNKDIKISDLMNGKTEKSYSDSVQIRLMASKEYDEYLKTKVTNTFSYKNGTDLGKALAKEANAKAALQTKLESIVEEDIKEREKR